MKLIVPFAGQLQAADARLIRLAELLGIGIQPLALPVGVGQLGEYLESAVPSPCSCLVVNPEVMRSWVGGDALPEELVTGLTSRFSHLIVHGLRARPFDARLVSALSQGQLHSVEPIGENCQYQIACNSKEVCGPFAGLCFGPANPANDCVLIPNDGQHEVRQFISIGGRPLMASVRREKSEILFLASDDVADLDAEVGDTPLSVYFSRLLPHAMALRKVFGEESWRPSGQHAAIIIDDPLLRDSYGFLNFESLRALMNRHRFHTTIAFIPHNYKRTSAKIARMFHENANKFGICFHGNDHTGAELASSNTNRLNTMLHIAEHRMQVHREITGLECGRVMVFPQGKFSLEAMRVLKSRNFYAAVNTTAHPMDQPTTRLTIGELAQPAVLRYGGFPLFLRKPIRETGTHDIAFNLFFGKPVLIVEHHDVFQHPDSLAEVADRINSVAPAIHWSNLATAVNASTLTRRSPDGVQHVWSYSGAARIQNNTCSAQKYSLEWGHAPGPQVEQILRNGLPLPFFEVDDNRIRVAVEMAPGDSQVFSVAYRNESTAQGGLGFRWTAKAFLRRRLSEIRDNHLSKNPRVLVVAKTLQRRFTTGAVTGSASPAVVSGTVQDLIRRRS